MRLQVMCQVLLAINDIIDPEFLCSLRSAAYMFYEDECLSEVNCGGLTKQYEHLQNRKVPFHT